MSDKAVMESLGRMAECYCHNHCKAALIGGKRQPHDFECVENYAVIQSLRTPPPAPSTPASVLEDVKEILSNPAYCEATFFGMAAQRLARHTQAKEGI